MALSPQPLLFQRAGRPDASMTLLTEVMERPLDPSYAAAAAQRMVDGPRTGKWSKWIIVSAAIVLGVITTIAAIHLQIPLSGARETRLLLEDQIRSRNLRISQISEQVSNLSLEIVNLQEAALTAGDPVLASQLHIDELHNGRAQLTGPGMVVTLTDGGGGLTEITSDHLVRDVDLQQVVSALWASGAEAISIEGQRLTMTTAIRNAGDAVLIDLMPILGPSFQVTAIGNPTTMETAWRNSGAPEYLAMLGSEFGIRSTAHVYPSLSVPSASPPVLRFAEQLESAAGNDSQS